MLNQRDIQKIMKQMDMENISAEEVVIRCAEKDIVVRNPQVVRTKMMGRETIQVTGQITEQPKANAKSAEPNEPDVRLVAEQAGVTPKMARDALKETGDIAAAIIKLRQQ